MSNVLYIYINLFFYYYKYIFITLYKNFLYRSLNDNKIKEIPKEIENLTKLEYLYV